MMKLALVLAGLTANVWSAEVVIRQVADINVGGDSIPSGFFEYDDLLYFSATGPQGAELYRTNGRNVELVADIFPGGNSSPSGFVELNDWLYFAATGPDSNSGSPNLGDRELYRFDGSVVQRVANVNPTRSSVPEELTVLDDWLYFRATTEPGFRLYRTNGQQTEPIDIVEGQASVPGGLTVIDNQLYFGGTGPVGAELYKTDGATVSLVADVNPLGDSFPSWITELDDKIVFSAVVDQGIEIYETDGAGARLVADINPKGHSRPNRFTEFDGALYFGAHGEFGSEVYRYDGTDVTLVQDLNPNETTDREGFPFSLDVFQDQLIVAAFGENGLELHRLDNDEFVEIGDINPAGHSQPYQLTEFAGDLFFGAFNEAGAAEGLSNLYRTDGDSIRLATDIGEDVRLPIDMTVYSGELFFRAIGEDGNELYKATLAGDADEDGTVGFADFLTFSSNFRTANRTWEQGDFDLDGFVTFSDFLLLSANFGATTLAANVPEPVGLACGWLLLGWCVIRRRLPQLPLR